MGAAAQDEVLQAEDAISTFPYMDSDPSGSDTVSSGDPVSGTGSTAVTAPASGEMEAVVLVDYTPYFEKLLETEHRQELQLEACISLLLIIVIAGVLNYIYKYFKMFI